MPVFPDDIRSLVMGNMGWPDDKVDKAVAICRFTVNENGEIMNIRVIKGTHPAFDKEAIRILSINSVRCAQFCNVPIRFKASCRKP